MDDIEQFISPPCRAGEHATCYGGWLIPHDGHFHVVPCTCTCHHGSNGPLVMRTVMVDGQEYGYIAPADFPDFDWLDEQVRKGIKQTEDDEHIRRIAPLN